MGIAPTRTKRRVSPAIRERKAQFRIALAIARLTARQWAKDNKVNEAFLSRFLAGNETSKPLDEKIATFIARYARNVA